MEQGWHRGLLLQVAVEWKWDRETFAEKCRKAGLPPQAWATGANVALRSGGVSEPSTRTQHPEPSTSCLNPAPAPSTSTLNLAPGTHTLQLPSRVENLTG